MRNFVTALAVAVTSMASVMLPTPSASVAAASTASDDPYFSFVRLADKTFYPRVRDGFKEYAHLYWESEDYSYYSEPTGSAYTVTNADGQEVYADTIPDGRTYLQWRGTNNSGSTVPVGTYTITLTTDDRYGQAHTLTRDVAVATKKITKRGWVHANGDTPGMYKIFYRGNCDTRYPYGSTDLIIDCWGGTFMQATFTLNIPKRHQRTAQITDFFMGGKKECCRRGTFDTRIWRADRNTVKATARVTGWRAYRVKYVQMDYKYEVRI